MEVYPLQVRKSLNMSDTSAIERRVQAIHLHLSPTSAATMQGLDRAATSSGQQSIWQDIPEVCCIDCHLRTYFCPLVLSRFPRSCVPAPTLTGLMRTHYQSSFM